MQRWINLVLKEQSTSARIHNVFSERQSSSPPLPSPLSSSISSPLWSTTLLTPPPPSSQSKKWYKCLHYIPQYNFFAAYRFHFLRHKLSVQWLVTLQKLNHQGAILLIFNLKWTINQKQHLLLLVPLHTTCLGQINVLPTKKLNFFFLIFNCVGLVHKLWTKFAKVSLHL